MLSISKSVLEEEIRLDKMFSINNRQFAKKIKNPIVSTYDFSGLRFQPILDGFKESEAYDEECVIFIPVIPQYFHNYFEVFSKIIYLQKHGEKFKVVFIHEFDEKENGVFRSLIRGSKDAACNAAHWKDFLEYRGIDFICLTSEELLDFRTKYTYLFYNDGEYGSEESYTYLDGKRYGLSHFLVHPNNDILVDDMRYMRTVYPKHKTIENKKIYISRKKTWDRKWDQEDKLEELLIKYGYENVFMEDLSFLEQIKLIQEASHIVCLYGSALVNCSLSNEDTRILSINITKGYKVYVYHDIFNEFKISCHVLDMAPTDSNTMLHIEKELLDWEKQG